MENVFGIIVKMSYNKLGDTSKLTILGKTMLDWVSMSLSDADFAVVDNLDEVEIPLLVRDYVNPAYKFTVILFSDTPLMTKKTVCDAIDELDANNMNVLKMTRGYVFRTNFLLSCDRLYLDNTYYFDEEDFIIADTYRQVGMVSEILRSRILNYHMDRGVRFLDTISAHIDADVVIGEGVEIGENNILRGKTIIKDNAKLLYNNVLEDAIIEENAEINSSRIYHSYIGEGTTVGPFAYIRPNSVIGPRCRIGDFVEIKSSVIGEGTKVSHLSYVGDCEIGDECNIGCGVVFVNYDGKNKFKTKVGNRVFVGSNSNIIAPLALEDGSFIAAGSTLTDSVPADALAIARARQVIKKDWEHNNYTKKD